MAFSFEQHRAARGHSRALFAHRLHPKCRCPGPASSGRSPRLRQPVGRFSPHAGVFPPPSTHPSHVTPALSVISQEGRACEQNPPASRPSLLSFRLQRSPPAEFQSDLQAVMRCPDALGDPTDCLGGDAT